jgi:hypothetical protein
MTFYTLWLLSKLGIVWDLHLAPARVRVASSTPSSSTPTTVTVVTAAE